VVQNNQLEEKVDFKTRTGATFFFIFWCLIVCLVIACMWFSNQPFVSPLPDWLTIIALLIITVGIYLGSIKLPKPTRSPIREGLCPH